MTSFFSMITAFLKMTVRNRTALFWNLIFPVIFILVFGRTLDVEQIGSVYETVMGFNLEVAGGKSIAIKPVKSHGAPAPRPRRRPTS